MNTDIRLAVSFRGHRKRKRLRLLLGPGSTDYLLEGKKTVHAWGNCLNEL